MKETREEIIDIYFQLLALEEKAACRSVNCEILDALQEAAQKVFEIKDRLTEIIGD